MTHSTVVLVLAQDATRLDAAVGTLRSEPHLHVKAVVLPELEESLSGAGRSRLGRLLPGRQHPTAHDHLVSSCRDLQVDAVVAADHESAKVARRLVADLPRLLAVMGADAALRVLAQRRQTGAVPGGSPDDVFGRTRFMPGTDSLPPVADSTESRLVIGPDNRDGRAGLWALLASAAPRPAFACQVVDGTDFFCGAADLSISRGELTDEARRRRFIDTVMAGTTHLLQAGASGLLPAQAHWPDGVRTAVVLDVIDLVPPELIEEIAAQVPNADAAAVAAWHERARRAAGAVERSADSVFVTDGGLPGAFAGLPVLPLALPPLDRVGAGGSSGPPLVVTSRPDIDLGGEAVGDPAADASSAMAAEGRIRHVSLTRLPPSLWVSAIKAADVVVDRLWLPGLGMAAAIALSMGVPVVAGTVAVPDEAPVARASLATLPDVLLAMLSELSPDDGGARIAFADRRREQARSTLSDFVRA